MEFLELPGAVADGEAGVPAHFGSPLIEQRALAAGNAVVDLRDRGVVTVTGPDRLSWLDSMTSQALGRLGAGESAETLLLSPQGRIDFAIRVADDGETAWLLVDPGLAPGLAAFLDRMRFMLRVAVADVSAEFAAVGSFAGGSAEAALAELAPAVTWRDPWAQTQPGGWQYANVSEHPGADWAYRESVLPRAALPALADAVAAGRTGAAGTLALTPLRVLAWRPSQAFEVDDRALPHEFDWLRSAVHLTKGCYRGQETVAKVHNLGHPPRRLTLLHLDGSDGELPLAGDLVFLADGEKPVGRISSVGLHHEWGGVALALLKRSVPVDAPLAVRGEGVTVAATQEIVVPPEAGATRDIPRLRRL